jgi:hypothetical protein
VLRLLGVELAVIYYAFSRPRRRAPVAGELSYTEKSGVGGLLLGLGLLVAMEGLSVHLLLRGWSTRAAWVHAGLNVYALVWLVAAFRAARLRPLVLSPARLLVRTSLFWTVAIPREHIASVAFIEEMPRGKGVLRAAFGAAPNLLLTLSEQVQARGPLGIERSVARVALYVDEPEQLEAALSTGTGEADRQSEPT